MRPSDALPGGRKGLTLTELVVAMAVAGILLAAGYGIFLTQQKTYALQDQITEIQQNARTAMNLLARDLRMAGHGVPTLWPVEIGGNTYAESVTLQGDTLTLLGCFGAPQSYLSRSAESGDVEVSLVDATDFRKHDRRYIFVGEFDKAIITGFDGNTAHLSQPLRKRYPTTRLTAAASPGDTRITVADTAKILAGDDLVLEGEEIRVIGVQGDTLTLAGPLRSAYPSGARVNPIPVYFVQALRYRLDPGGIITREDLGGGGRQGLAENISALHFTELSRGVYRIVLVAKTEVADKEGKFRSRTYELTVRVRNPE